MVTTPAPSSRRNIWIAIAVGAVLLVAIAVAGVVLGGIVFYARHVHTASIAEQAARDEFDRTLARFAGQTPLVEIQGERNIVLHRTPDAPRRPIAALRVLVYDAREGRRVSVDVPAWLLQFTSLGGRFRIASLDALSSQRVTLEDLERHGPGLILDAREPDGARVLVWTE
jgi:hypothetical protein